MPFCTAEAGKPGPSKQACVLKREGAEGVKSLLHSSGVLDLCPFVDNVHRGVWTSDPPHFCRIPESRHCLFL